LVSALPGIWKAAGASEEGPQHVWCLLLLVLLFEINWLSSGKNALLLVPRVSFGELRTVIGER